MRVLVTGTSGFIGRHVARRLRNLGHFVIGLDRLALDAPDLVQHEIVCDLLNGDRLSREVGAAKPDAVVHLAARTDLAGKDLAAYASNVQGVENLIAAIATAGCVHRAVFASSQLVCKLGHVPSKDDEYLPSTTYGASKARMEQIVRQTDGGRTTWCLVRPTTVWGPGMRDHYVRFFGMIARGRYFHVGHRPLYKSFGYVGNVAYQLERLLSVGEATVSRRTLYLADYSPLSLRAWVDEIQDSLGASEVRTIPVLVARAAALGGDALNLLGWASFPFNSFRLNNVLTEYIFDLRATEEICGPVPYTVTDGVRETVAWLRSLPPGEPCS